MACPACGGKGCDQCDGGEFAIDGCPRKMVSGDVWELIRHARLYDKGLPPVGGGVLDQTRSFTEGCEFVWAEENRWKAEDKGR